ncbi:MAG TPA: caspase family protein [Kofleriaceae bacterium]|nr:caspase family protein [Kofleriaceae bacterium]
MRWLVLAAVLAAGMPGARAAAPPDPAAHALVVGSNAGGRGQAELRFAERDARRMAELLRELGGFPAEQVDLVLAPSRSQLDRALDRLARRVADDVAAGRTPRVLFYYSGHARATALNLGPEELSLVDLRARLLAMSGGLTVVVLDACQSGAFSRVKGAAPAADFSYNSLARLSATGIAVLASSTGSELSQESDRLASSYFTHHLIVGLRGAGDTSKDGKVSLDEAYRYAYHQTLLATAATAVGAQHVSLEVDLKGKGEVAITHPSTAGSHLELPAALDGEVLVERRRAGAVVAELHKARGEAVRLALAPGEYRVLVRAPGADHLDQCDLVLPRGGGRRLDTARCEEVALRDESAKGGPGWRGPRLAIELGVGPAFAIDDEFTDRLEGFGYQDRSALVPGHVGLAVLIAVHRHLEVGGEIGTLGSGRYAREADTRIDYHWNTQALGAVARGRYPLFGSLLSPYLQVGAGVATSSTSLDAPTMDQRERYWGWHASGAVGLELMPWRHLGFFAQASLVTAPVIENLAGDSHDSGGAFWRVGLRGAFLEDLSW